MRLTKAEFDDKQSRGQLRIALIGMSNIGKSYTASRIAKTAGFTCYDVDAEIQAKMGISDMDAMAKWMGHPYEDGYADKASEYLALEAELSLKSSTIKGNLILDTTGSVIHINDAAKANLKDNFLIVYIKASPADMDVLIDRYFKYPKPTIWGNQYRNIPGKSDDESLLACYPDLLELRTRLYEDLADITIDAEDLSKSTVKDTDILPLFCNHLPSK